MTSNNGGIMRSGKVVCGLAAGCAALVIGNAPAAAQEWKPGKTVELVVGSAPGGSPDVMARLIQSIFQNTGLVANSAVVNKPGAANTIGWAYLNQHVGDAHYIATFSPALIGNRIMGPKGLKPPEIAYWDATFAKLAQSEEWKKDTEQQFWNADYLLSAETRKYLERENDLTKGILTDLGLAKQ